MFPGYQDVHAFFMHGKELIPDYDVILCTEKGVIAFLNQPANQACIMQYANGFDVMQYCTQSNNEYTEKVEWITHDYWQTTKDSYDEVRA